MPQPPILTDPEFLQSSVLSGITITVNDFLPPAHIVASRDIYEAMLRIELDLVAKRAADKRAGVE